jgi:HEAT repeat protein
MTFRKSLLFLSLFSFLFVLSEESAYARRKRTYSGPPPTHPVILWSRTLEESKDAEQRKVAAFKLSKYTQPIFQPKVVSTLMKCAKDPDVQIKVLCTKALGGAKAAALNESIRELLLGLYASEPGLRNTVVRTLVARKDDVPAVQKLLADALLKSEDSDESIVLLRYFEEFDPTDKDFAEKLVDLYDLRSNVKVRRSIVKVIGIRANGQDKVIELLARCAQERDTPLALNCLSSMQAQGKKDSRAWAAVQKTLQSDDPDVLLASLDVINALPDTKNPEISKRLLELVDDIEDPDIVERAVLALGVCGDQTEETVNSLQKVFKNQKTEEATRIAAALTLGKQAIAFPDTVRDLLKTCTKEGASQSLKTACQLGLNELPAATTVTQ